MQQRGRSRASDASGGRSRQGLAHLPPRSGRLVDSSRHRVKRIVPRIIGQCNKRKESLLISKLVKYIISGPALGPKPFFNRVLVNTGSCRAFLLLASSQQLVSDSFKDDQYSEGDCVIVQGSLKQNAIFWTDFMMDEFPWKMDMCICFILSKLMQAVT